MARNPTPGGDRGKWGTVLNERLNELSSAGVAAQETADTAVANAATADGKAVAAQDAVDAVAPEGGARAVGKGELTVNVRDFGAVGDDATDDTAAFDAWLDHLISENVEGYIPPGTYRITSSLERWDVPVGVVIRGAGARTTFLYGDFVSPGEGILGFNGTNHTTGYHRISGIGFLGNGVAGDPIGLNLMDAWECVVSDIDAPYGVNGAWNLANSVIVVTNDNNGKFTNIRGQAGWQPAAFDLSGATASFTSGSATVTVSSAVLTADMVGETIYFASGSAAGTHGIWSAEVTAVDPDGLSCTIDDDAPTTGASVSFRVGYVLGSVAEDSDSLTINNIVGLTDDYVGMQVHVMGADAKADATSSPGVLSTHITAVSGNTITLAADATETVTDAVVLFAPNVFIGTYKEFPFTGQQTNHSWWHDVHCEGYRAAGIIVNRAIYLTIDNLKVHGAGYGSSPKWGECYYWAVFSEIKSADVKGIQGAFGVMPSRFHVSGSRGILGLDNFEMSNLYLNGPAVEITDVTPEFRLSLGDALITYPVTSFDQDWHPILVENPFSVEYKGTFTHRNKANTQAKAGGIVRRGITGVHGAVRIEDDSVFTWRPEGTFGVLHISSENVGVGGIYWYRTSDNVSAANVTEIFSFPSGAMNVISSATTLSGTTGPDSLVTIAPDSSGNLQIENRRSFAVKIALLSAPYGA